MTKNNTYITIMAGGIGSRFWPASRKDMPKQFLDILGTGKSLIQQTFQRFLALAPPENILILTNERYKNLVLEHLPELPPNNVLCEPSMNNTAPAIAYAALRLKAMNPEAVFIVAPSDHVVLKSDVFIDKLRLALQFASDNKALVTLGIQPSRPDTGYGYIEMTTDNIDQLHNDIVPVKRFVEKPDLQTAKSYLKSGNFLWNAGIFIWHVNTILEAFKNHTTGILEPLEEQYDLLNTQSEQSYIDRVYPNTTKISIDYAILEKADNVYTLPSDIGWSDLGTWNSLYAYLEKDADGNVIQSPSAQLYDTKDCYIRMPKDKKIVMKGLKDYIVIDEGDVLLIYPKNLEQEIKNIKHDH